MENKVIQGDCLGIMKEMEDNSIDAVITDPPYGLSFMGKKWDYDVPSVEIWEECLRVLKPGGYLLAFAGTRTQHRMAVRIEDAGFEIRDMIAWVYGSGFPKSLNIGKAVDKLQGNEREKFERDNGSATSIEGKKTIYGSGENKSENGTRRFIDTKGTSEWEGWGTALKPALEPITVARKPLEGHEISNLEEYLDKQGFPSLSKILKKKKLTVAENCLKWGVGGINIDGCRIPANWKEERPESWFNSGTSKGGSTYGGNLKTITDTTVGDRLNEGGRFPSNLITDGSDEVVSLFPNTGKGNGKGAYNYAGKEYDNKDTSMFNGDKPQAPSNFNDSGSASRFFMTCKYTPNDAIMKLCEDNINANNAEWSLPITNLIEAVVNISSVLKSATPNIDLLNQNLNALFVEKIPKNTAIDFVAKLAAISEVPEVLLSQQELQATQDFIINYKNSIQTQNLASAEKLENTDITQITINLLKLCGFVVLVIDENTSSDTKEKAEQKLEPKRFAYIPKASKSERNRGCEGLDEKDKAGKDFRPNHTVKAELGEDGNPFGRWGKIKNNHPTVKPIKLMEYLVKLVSREGAVVLDPFAGSGSTLIACKNLNRNYIGIELDNEYIEIINKRLTTTN